ncbi:MAG: PD-(D/E)XK nuclease family protein, partial [Gammaproteobacteria bacterium]
VALTRARQMLCVSAAVTDDTADSGWYGLLRAQWDRDGCLTRGEPYAHRSGTLPAAARSVPDAAPTEPGVDPRLRERLQPPALLLRIAPSRATDPHADAGPDAETGDADGRRRGAAIHRLLEWLGGTPPRTREQLLAGLARELQRDADDPELGDWLREAEAVLRDPALAPLFDRAAYASVHTEVPIQYFRGEALVDGIIDRLLLDEHSAHIIDYKTHIIDAEQIPATAAGYREQMRLYADGVRRLWPARRVRASLLFTHCRTLIDIDT